MIRLVLYANLYIAVAAATLTLGSARLFGAQEASWALAAVVFGATLLIYNLDRLLGASREDRWESTERHLWIGGHQKLLWGLVVVGSICCVVGSLWLRGETLIVLAVLATISLLYAVPVGLAKEGSRWRLKQVPAMKTALVALVWAVVTVVLPASEQGIGVGDGAVVQETLLRGLFVYALTLPFDVRDRRRDEHAGLTTMAVLLGDRAALGLSAVLIGIWTVFAGQRWAMGGEVLQWTAVATGALTLLALGVLWVWRTRGEVSPWYHVGVLDGMLLLYGVFLLV